MLISDEDSEEQGKWRNKAGITVTERSQEVVQGRESKKVSSKIPNLVPTCDGGSVQQMAPEVRQHTAGSGSTFKHIKWTFESIFKSSQHIQYSDNAFKQIWNSANYKFIRSSTP